MQVNDEKANEGDLVESVSDDVIEGEAVVVEQAAEGTETVLEEDLENAGEEALHVEPSCEDQLQMAQDEAAKHLDSYLRSQAELANARKRFEKQRAQTYVNANADLVRKLLPVLDDYERAIGIVPEPVQVDPWYAGIELVYRKLLGILESMNVTEIEAVGQPFDPNFHEALGMEPSDELESGVVTRVMQKGYRLGDHIVRPSLVFVAD